MRVPVLISGALLGSRELITELGGDPDSLAQTAGLSARVFDEPDMFVAASNIVDFLELAARSLNYPSFALAHAHRLPLGIRGLGIRGQGWMLMRDARTIREALRDFVGIYGLYTDAGKLRLQVQRGESWLSYVFLPVGRWGEVQIVHLTLARLCLFIGESLARAWQPASVELRITPDDPNPYYEFFGPNIVFGSERDAILIDHETLTTKISVSSSTDDPARIRGDLSGSALRAEVVSLLGTLLRHETCSVDVVAKALGFSTRTLQRRLAANGSNFMQLVDEVRADLAWRHVTQTTLTLGRVAELIGYQNQAAFSRAFRRWHGVSALGARRTEA